MCKVLGIPGRCLNGRRTSVPPVTGDGFFFSPYNHCKKKTNGRGKRRSGGTATRGTCIIPTNCFWLCSVDFFSFNDQRNERRFQLSCVSGGLVMLAVYLLLPCHIVRISPPLCYPFAAGGYHKVPPRNQGTPRLFVVALYGWFQMVFVKLFYSI